MRRIDLHCSADTRPWDREWEKLGYQDVILKLSTRTPSVVFGL
jgi:hypothetical protein